MVRSSPMIAGRSAKRSATSAKMCHNVPSRAAIGNSAKSGGVGVGGIWLTLRAGMLCGRDLGERSVRPMFVDEEKQAQFERDDYLVTPFLSDDEVEAIRSGYTALGPMPGDPGVACIASFLSYDGPYKRG